AQIGGAGGQVVAGGGGQRRRPPLRFGGEGGGVGAGGQRADECAEPGFRCGGGGVPAAVPRGGELVDDGPPGDVVDDQRVGHHHQPERLGGSGGDEVDVAALFRVEGVDGGADDVIDGQGGLAEFGIEPAELAVDPVGGRGDAQH